MGDYSAYRDICHKVKTSYRPFLREAAGMMADLLTLPSDGVLIPMPSHLGYATDTLDLCKELSSLTGLPVMDILHGDMRESIHNLKSLTGVSSKVDFHQSGIEKGTRERVRSKVTKFGYHYKFLSSF